jgi:alpha-tubulin suppressor-like RCC1 family protein
MPPIPSARRTALVALLFSVLGSPWPAQPAHAMGSPQPPTATSHPVEYCSDRDADDFYDPADCTFYNVEGTGDPALYDYAEKVVWKNKSLPNNVDNCPRDLNPQQEDTDHDGVGDACEYVDVQAGENHACALRADGAVSCWGDNAFGKASAPVWNFSAITVGRNHACGLLNSTSAAQKGRVHCWGDNRQNQINAKNGQFVKIQANGDVTCAIDKDGGAKCWGACGSDEMCTPPDERKYFQLAPAFDETPEQSDTPLYSRVAIDAQTLSLAQVDRFAPEPPAGQYIAVDGGDRHACALKLGDGIACWTRRHRDGRPDDAALSPPAAGQYFSISVGFDHACAVANTDHQVRCWGSNEFGKATPPPGLGRVHVIAVGKSHSCALKESGSIACWGDHGVTSGAVFSLDAPNKLLPRAPQYGEISANEFTACVVDFRGKISCSSLSQPTYFSPPGEFYRVFVGEGKSCGLRRDGSFVCWDGTSGATEEAPGVAEAAVRRYFDPATMLPREYMCGIFKNTQKVFCRDQGAPMPRENDFAFGPSFTHIGVMGDRMVCGITTDERFLCQDYRAGREVEPKPGKKFTEISCVAGQCCVSGHSNGQVCYSADGKLTQYYENVSNLTMGPTHGCGLIPANHGATCFSRDPSYAIEPSGVQTAPHDIPMGEIASGEQFACGLTSQFGTPICWGQVKTDNIARDYLGRPIRRVPWRDLGNRLDNSVLLSP